MYGAAVGLRVDGHVFRPSFLVVRLGQSHLSALLSIEFLFLNHLMARVAKLFGPRAIFINLNAQYN